LASNAKTNFRQFAQTTVVKASQLYGTDKRKAVSDAWASVGLAVTAPGSPRASAKGEAKELEAAEIHLAELTRQIELLSDRVRDLTSEVEHSLHL
jgi:hypothetical protein